MGTAKLRLLHRDLFMHFKALYRRRNWLLPLYVFLGLLSAAQTASTDLASDLLRRAEIATTNNRLDQAADLYRRALAERPQWARAEFGLAMVYHSQNNLPEAIRLFSKTIAHAPSIQEAYLYRGIDYYRLNQFSRAVASLKQALRLHPANRDAVSILAASYYAMEDYPQAAAAYMDLLRLNPNEADAYFQLSEAYLGVAHEAQRRIYNAPNARYFALLLNAEQSLDQRQYAAAEPAVKEAMGLSPSSPEAWLTWSRSKEEQSQTADAENAILQALKREITRPTSLRNIVAAVTGKTTACTSSEFARAMCSVRQANLSGTKQVLAFAGRAGSQEPQELYWTARITLFAAREAIVQLAKNAPDSPNLRRVYARQYKQDGKREKADQEYREAVSRSNADPTILIEYANFKVETQEYAEAITLMQKALRLDPFDFRLRGLLGETYLKQNNPAEAVKYLAQALQAEDSPQLRIYLAEGLSRLDKLGSAIAVLESAKDDPDGKLAYILSTYYSRNGDEANAKRAIARFRKFQQAKEINK